MNTQHHTADLCVVGGGLSGLCAAVAAARHGAKVVLMQDRPVLGGNASSEIRMWVCGAHGPNNRETGLLEELELENFYRNSSLSYPVWDSVLYGMAKAESNLELLLNCSCLDCTMDGERIQKVKGWQLTTQTYHEVEAAFFADCSGDSILAPLSGAKYRVGREAREEYGEDIAPIQADKKTMGMSCLFQIRETDRPQTYIPPDWAYTYPDDSYLPECKHYIGDNYWWIEVGGEADCIADTEQCRDELLKIAFGVWDHFKNQAEHGVENWALDWVGFLPGKRESRRYIGEYVVTQHDVRAAGPFEDIIAYGGWSMDDHFPAGFYHRGSHPTIYHPAPSPWGIPFRSLYSVNISNLLFAGRNISVTHTALSSSRVMGTCAMLGQAVGTAVAQAVRLGKGIREIDVALLQQELLYDDCYLPGIQRVLSPLTLAAHTNAPAVTDGYDRPDNTEYHGYVGDLGQAIELRFEQPVQIQELRLVFDSNLNRPHHNMPCTYFLDEKNYRMPETLIRSYQVEADTSNGKVLLAQVENNRRRMVRHQVGKEVTALRLIPQTTWGDTQCRVFSMDVR